MEPSRPWCAPCARDSQELRDSATLGMCEGQGRFEKINELLKKKIEKGQVSIYRMTSLDAVSSFRDGYFDWIYIDAIHYFSSVMDDLTAYAEKVRPGGILQGTISVNIPPLLQ